MVKDMATDVHFTYGPNAETHPLFAHQYEIGGEIAVWGNGEKMGWIVWDDQDVIEDIYVAPEYRRQGVATVLFSKASKIRPDLQHSEVLTDNGRAWSATVPA